MTDERDEQHQGAPTPLAQAPTWTNPYIGMVALATAVIKRWGAEGEAVISDAFFDLGLRTGAYMREQRVTSEQPGAQEWGRLTEKLLDLTGITDHTVVEDTPDRFTIMVRSCPYVAAYRALGSPSYICRIPTLWDRGCIAALNPRLTLTQPKTLMQDDSHCLYVIEQHLEPQVDTRRAEH